MMLSKKIVVGSLLLVFIAVFDGAPLTSNNTSTTTATKPQSIETVTYSILNIPEELTWPDVQRTIKKAFNTWSAVIPLNFIEIERTLDVDIRISFEADQHGDRPFNFTYAHILSNPDFNPVEEIHFNNEYFWAINTPGQKYNNETADLYYHSLFVIGQVLGLQNTDDPKDIMYSKYILPVDANGNYVEQKLSPADVEAAQKLYGAKNA